MNNQNISEILDSILTLQKNADNKPCNTTNCTRPFLGQTDNPKHFNTRPITMYSCCTGERWEFPYEINGVMDTSTIFRIENVEGNCATFRVLIPNNIGNNTSYTLSNSYFTIDLSCVLAIQCLNDTYIN